MRHVTGPVVERAGPGQHVADTGGGGGWGVEALANLDALPAKGETLVVGAPNVRGGTGGPTRVFALV